MMFWFLFCWLSFCLCNSCSKSLQHPSILFSIQHLCVTQNSPLNSSTVQSISSIRILGVERKEPSREVLIAMKQCESAILKPKNDQMMKGPSFCLGLLKQSFGDFDGALNDYERAVLHFPANGAASFNAAGILENMGRDLEAATKYKLAMVIPEMCESSISKLIPLLLRNSLDDEAHLVCTEMISGPHFVRYKALECLGTTLCKMKKFTEALSAYESALAVCDDPMYSSDVSEKRQVEALNNAAQAAAKVSSNGRKTKEKAEKYHLKSIEIAPNNADSHTYYGIFLKYENRNEEAVTEFRKALSLDPTEKSKETGYAAVQLASITGGSSQRDMSGSYISGLFDGYADRFDEELCGKLEYKGHEQVVSSLIKSFRKADKVQGTTGKEEPRTSRESLLNEVIGRNIIDIGCGTGLCGALIRNQLPSALISGADLSQRMLEKCILRGCYNSLVLGDAVEYLNTIAPSSVDAIIAADVFIYVGDLRKVFQSSHKALKDNDSYLVFTVEELSVDTVESILVLLSSHPNPDPNQSKDDLTSSTVDNQTENGFRLKDCGRFSHSERYIRKLAREIGFKFVSAEQEFIRLQSEVPVRSITFILSKT